MQNPFAVYQYLATRLERVQAAPSKNVRTLDELDWNAPLPLMREALEAANKRIESLKTRGVVSDKDEIKRLRRAISGLPEAIESREREKARREKVNADAAAAVQKARRIQAQQKHPQAVRAALRDRN